MRSAYLATQLEVCHHDRNLSTAHNQNAKHQEQESKKVVELILPNCRKHEE